MADTYKFRIDHHGSLIRPAELLAARARYEAREIGDGDLRSVEDHAIADAVRLQRSVWLSVITDGDFRREDFRGAILDTVGGFRRGDDTDQHGYRRWTAVGTPRSAGPADDVAALAALAVAPGPGVATPVKVTLPSPAFLAARTFDPEHPGPWGSAQELGEALAAIVRAEIEAVIANGAKLIQLNNPAYARALFARGTDTLPLDDAIAVDTLAVRLDAKPADVRIGLNPTHRAADPVDKAVAERLFAELPVDRWVLPYHAGTDAETDLLRAVPADRDACLGIVDAENPELEDVDDIMRRIDIAADLKDVEDLAVSPNRGFADVAATPRLTAEEQRRKLIHVETIARMTWGNEL
ncbi:uroporphyrinogen decarboxylase/cobalamine-independent methonine synthase family protein [Nocardia aurantia]|uniref:Cobalamin-independent methionine synthase MetE C-terminal/archaeal domain-containing protein n=1 Tax=Nocardia aurantia TaxID=2585199 RepID=A0A7K0DPH1_9NOCA|nr:methionine synthase II (cobalamin-independent)-like protein [Nocardia aurantia]MQY27643.1 hypothetical protein [Nocardia aurantia]